MNNLKLVDVRAYEDFKGLCSNCGRKLKNEYVLSDGQTIGSECIIKILGDGLEITENIKNLSHKLKTIKFILNKCKTVLVSGEILDQPNNPEFKTYFYVWLYDENKTHFASFKYRMTREKLKEFMQYFNRNDKIIYVTGDDNEKEISFNKFLGGLKNDYS